MCLTTGGNDFIAGRNSAAITNIKLNLSNVTDTFITDVFFTEFSTLGLDPGYDASLLGGTAPTFALYSHLVQDNADVPLAIQTLGKTDYRNVTISLGVNANQGEQLTFSRIESTLPNTVEVYLDDTVTNSSTLLNTSDYILTPNVNLNGTGRFFLRFMDSALSATQNDVDDLNIYTNQKNKTIVISGQLALKTLANIYDIQGRLVKSKVLDAMTRVQIIDVSPLQSGIYVVYLSKANAIRTEKIIIKNN